MPTTYAERHELVLRSVYGPFVPHSDARAIREANARRGFKTCWHCLEAFRPVRVVESDGTLYRPGRGRWYCSPECARAYRAETQQLAREVSDAAELEGAA